MPKMCKMSYGKVYEEGAIYTTPEGDYILTDVCGKPHWIKTFRNDVMLKDNTILGDRQIAVTYSEPISQGFQFLD